MSEVITSNLEIWTSSILKKSTAGRGSNGKQAAYGIKKLRELILELALRGKLIPQDPNDEPANVLLEKIAKEKARLIKDGSVKKQKPLSEITDDEKYCTLPIGWEWSRLGEVTNYGITDKAEPGDVGEETWVLELEDVEKETSKLLRKIRYSEKQFQSSKNRFAKNDVIYGKLRPYLDKVIVADEDGVCTTEMIPVRGYIDISPFYLRLVMKSPHFIRYADDSTHGMNLPRLGTDKARMALFPVAPLAEQLRIVAKVDELMALCDQLEQQQTDSIEAHQTLVETLLGTLTNVETAEEFNHAWSRIVNHFDTLFTTEQSIDQLKQTILQLAVIGKLVTKDANDRPVAELLERIFQEKELKVKNGKIRKDKPFVSFEGLDDLKRALPDHWSWVRLANIADIVRGGSPRPAGDPNYYDGNIPFLKVADVSRAQGKYVKGYTYTIKKAGLNKTRYIDEKTVLLTNSGATLGIPAICDFPTTFNDGIAAFVELSQYVFDEYLYLYLDSLTKWFIDIASRGQGQPNLNTDIIKSTWFSLPPTNEQHRIVAKVDELMALCDALKARITEAQTTQLHLADAIVEQAVN